MAAVQHRAGEGNVEQCWGVSSSRGGALLFISRFPASCQGAGSRLGGPQGMPGRLPRAWAGVADGWGAGDRGAGEDQGHLSAQTTVASLFRVIYNWAKNGDVAAAPSLLCPRCCGQSKEQIWSLQSQ